MTGFLGKIFGKKSEESVTEATNPVELIGTVLDQVFYTAGMDLQVEVSASEEDENQIHIEIFGEDEDLLRQKDGQLLDAFQLFITRVAQHQLRDLPINITMDSAGYREEANKSLMDIAEKLKNIAVEKGKPVYVRALPPRDRKVIHQYLADDGRVKSRSIGDGLFKKIKILPVKDETHIGSETEAEADAQ